MPSSAKPAFSATRQLAVLSRACCRVAEKAGFALEGTQRGSCLLATGYVDEHLHARVAGA